MTLTERFSSPELNEHLYGLRKFMSDEMQCRVEYEILLVNYQKAKDVCLKRLHGMGQEVRSFPMYDDMCNILWTVAEFTSDKGERLEFRREGYTTIEVTYYAPNDIDKRD